MTVPLPEKHSPRSRDRSGGTIVALLFLLGCAAGLLALTSMILPQISGLVLVVGGLCGFVSLHYFTWGRWLTRTVQVPPDELELPEE